MVGQNSEIGRESVRIADAFGETVVQLAARGAGLHNTLNIVPHNALHNALHNRETEPPPPIRGQYG